MFARRMAAPIVALRKGEARIAGGDLDARIASGGDDEIEALAHDVNAMAANLSESYAGLEAEVDLRTAELSEARDRLQAQATEVEGLNRRLVEQLAELALRRDEAERANASKSRFLATASHDLRQPMHSISLLVDVLRHRLEAAELVALARKVQASVATMETLFGSLPDIFKLDAGAVHSDIHVVDIARLVDRVTRGFAPQAVERGIRLRVRVDAASAHRPGPAGANPQQPRLQRDLPHAARRRARRVQAARRPVAAAGLGYGMRYRATPSAVDLRGVLSHPGARHDARRRPRAGTVDRSCTRTMQATRSPSRARFGLRERAADPC